MTAAPSISPMSRSHPGSRDAALAKFSQPLNFDLKANPSFYPKKSPDTLCIQSLQGSCKNGRRCNLIHPPGWNIIEAIRILIEDRYLSGSSNHLFVNDLAKEPGNSKAQICLNFLKRDCFVPSGCSRLHVTCKALSFFAEPLGSPFAPHKRDSNQTNDPETTVSMPQIISNDSTQHSAVPLPTGAEIKKEDSLLSPASVLPSRYDETSPSSSETATSEDEDSKSSGPTTSSPATRSVERPLATESSPIPLDALSSHMLTQPCLDFFNRGSGCWRGSSCKFRHSGPSETLHDQKDVPITAQSPSTIGNRQPLLKPPTRPSVSVHVRGTSTHITEQYHSSVTSSQASAFRSLETDGLDLLLYRSSSDNDNLRPVVRLPQPKSSPLPSNPSQPTANPSEVTRLLQHEKKSGVGSSAVDPRHELSRSLRIILPEGYCYDWIHFGGCPFRTCMFMHEFPLNWDQLVNESRHPSSGPKPPRFHAQSSQPSVRGQSSAALAPQSFQQRNHPSEYRLNSQPHALPDPKLSLARHNKHEQSPHLPFPPQHNHDEILHPASSSSITIPQSSSSVAINRPTPLSAQTSQHPPPSGDDHTRPKQYLMLTTASSQRLAPPPKITPTNPSTASRGSVRAQREDLTLPILDPIRATFGPGFCVKGIVTSNDTRMVNINNVPRSVSREALEKFISPYANVIDIRIPDAKDESDHRPMRVTVTLASHHDAVRIVESLDGAKVFSSCLDLRLLLPLAAREQASGGDLCITWPLATKRCYGGYNTEKEAKQAIERFNGVDIRGYWVTASMYEGLPVVGLYNVRFDGMPPDTTVKQMNQFKADSVMMDRPPPMLERFGLPAVEKIIRNCGKLIYFEPAPMPSRDGVARAWCRFESTDIAHLACELSRVPQRSLKDQCLEIKRMCSLRYHIDSTTYVVIQDDIEELKASVSKRYPGSSIRVTERESRDSWSDSMTIRILAETSKEVSAIKARLVDMVRGETIMNGNRPLWDRSFGMTSGQPWLDSVRRANRSVIVIADAARCFIRVVGAPEKRKKVIAEITDYYAILRERPVYSIPLPNGLIGLFVHSELVAEGKYSPEDMWLDMPKRLLCVRADEAVYEQIQQKVHLATEQHGSPGECAAQDKCLVCLAPPTTPVELPCGHKYCKACFVGYLNSATETRIFPIECFGADAACKEPVPLVIARDIMPPTDWIALLRAAFNTHVSARPDEFRYCPTPDCPQVYRPGPRGSVYSCPACLVRICPHCHVEYHEGVICEDYELGHDHEAMFEKWMQENNVKPCPKCKVPIERRDGCNHMQCSRCLTHMCWVCMATFETSGSVYHHMGAEHGGAF